MGLFCMPCWGVNGSWGMIPRMSQLFTHLQQWVVVCVHSVMLNNIYSCFLPTAIDCLCMYTSLLWIHASILSGSLLFNQAVPTASNSPWWLWVWEMHSAAGQAGSRMDSSWRRVPLLELCWYFHHELFTYVTRMQRCSMLKVIRPMSHCSRVSLVCLQPMLKTWYMPIPLLTVGLTQSHAS